MHPDSFAIAFHHWRATRQFNNVNCYISNGRWKICVLRTQSVFGRRQTTEINWQHWHLKGDQQDDEIRSKHVWELAIKCKFRYLSTTEQHQLHAIAWAQTRIGDSTITATGKKKSNNKWLDEFPNKLDLLLVRRSIRLCFACACNRIWIFEQETHWSMCETTRQPWREHGGHPVYREPHWIEFIEKMFGIDLKSK